MALAFLDRNRSIVPLSYSRWLVPPAALAIQSLYRPGLRLLGLQEPAPRSPRRPTAPPGTSKRSATSSPSPSHFLGIFGAWLERAGPRRAMFYSALCFGSGFLVASAGVTMHSLALIYLGYGVIGGIGLGLGYISPVSTLIKWFPDRPRPRHRPGHYGLWRRSHDRRPARQPAYGPLQGRWPSPPSPTP